MARLSAVLALAAGLVLGPCPLTARAEDAPPTPETAWPFQRPLFALSPAPATHVRLSSAFATGPLTSALGLGVEGSLALAGQAAVRLRVPLGLGLDERGGTAFSLGDVELGVLWRIVHDPANERQLSVGLDLSGPTSRLGEPGDPAAVQLGQRGDDSNFGKRYLLAQRPLLDMGLNPKTNLTVTPWVALGQNLGRVSLQADFGCLLLVQDNLDETVYGTRKRVGAVMFFDLAAPVSLTRELSLVAELGGLVSLDTLTAAGLNVTLGARYELAGFALGLGVQVPLLVDGEGREGDYVLGRLLHAALARQHLAVLLDLAYRFE